MHRRIMRAAAIAIFATTIVSPSLFAGEELKTFGQWCEVYAKEHQEAFPGFGCLHLIHHSMVRSGLPLPERGRAR